MKLASGESVVNRPQSRIHPDILTSLGPALERISSEGRQFFVEEIDFGQVIGRTTCVATAGPDDEIVYARKTGQVGYTRFVKKRKPEKCNTLVVILMKGHGNDGYVLVSAFIGGKREPEPWSPHANANSRPFWDSHALIWGSESVDKSTETTECPW